MNVKVVVAAHKPYWVPDDRMYIPLQVGKAGHLALPGFLGDDIGDNISGKNPNYCELTGLYWAWKNIDADYMGLVHYRRHFTVHPWENSDKRDRVLTESEAEELLLKTDILLPSERHYWIESSYGQYIAAHHAKDLDTVREVIKERCPEYLQAFDHCMKSTKGHRFNMFIMKKVWFDAYCTWLFDILFELERRLDISMYSPEDKRVFGHVSERLLDVFLWYNHVESMDIHYLFMENQNWLKKGLKFVGRSLKARSKMMKAASFI